MSDVLVGGAWSLPAGTEATMRLRALRQAFERMDYERTLLEAEELLDVHPDHPEALGLLGEALLEMGDAPLARLALEQLLAVSTPDLPRTLALATARFETCDIYGAESLLLEVVRQAPMAPDVHHQLGLVLEWIPGEQETAAGHLALAHALAPDLFPTALALEDTDWECALSEALLRMNPELQGFWSGVPVRFMERPDLDMLTSTMPPLPPTLAVLAQGSPPPASAPPTPPSALFIFTTTLTRLPSFQELVETLSQVLQDEALHWLQMGPEDLLF